MSSSRVSKVQIDDEISRSGHTEPAIAYMLAFELLDGSKHAFEYSHLYRIELSSNGEIVLEFSGHSVTVQGRNLDRLFSELVSHRCQLIAATDPLQGHLQQGCVVTSVVIAEKLCDAS